MELEGMEGKEEDVYLLTREGCMHRGRERYKTKARRDHTGGGKWRI